MVFNSTALAPGVLGAAQAHQGLFPSPLRQLPLGGTDALHADFWERILLLLGTICMLTEHS